ncbi:MAG TPA: DUF3106 domain-containing protein, partial [Candidatus Berkiella sp.]|nr:DUF3106 domain-containing protein [Candidatus Berkiella sp.]
MMNKKAFTVLLLAGFGMSSITIAADNATTVTTPTQATDKSATTSDTVDFKAAKEKYKKMTPEQRKEFNANTKKKWDSMSEQDKQNFKTKVQAHADKLKEKIRERNK